MAKINLERTYLHQPFNEKFQNHIVVALIGRYISNPQAYLSILDALKTAGQSNQVSITVKFIQSIYLNEKNVADNLSGVDAIIIPGGFGQCGLEGKIAGIHYARVNKIPMFGICLGFQLTVIEYARNVCGLTDANTSEIDKNCKCPVVDKLENVISKL